MSNYRVEIQEKVLEEIFIALMKRTDSDKLVLSPHWLLQAAGDFRKNGQCSITFEKMDFK